MTATSEQVGRAMSHATLLMEEANNWEALTEERGTLASVMDHSMQRVSGVEIRHDHALPTEEAEEKATKNEGEG